MASQTEMMKRSERVCGSGIAQSFRQFLIGLLSPEDFAALHRMLTDAAGETVEGTDKANVRKLGRAIPQVAGANRGLPGRRAGTGQ